MNLFQIENITFEPMLVIADDYDHAAEIFRHTLVRGLAHLPDADFDITRWRIKRHHRDQAPWCWVDGEHAGMLYNINHGDGWELVRTTMIRGRTR